MTSSSRCTPTTRDTSAAIARRASKRSQPLRCSRANTFSANVCRAARAPALSSLPDARSVQSVLSHHCASRAYSRTTQQRSVGHPEVAINAQTSSINAQASMHNRIKHHVRPSRNWPLFRWSPMRAGRAAASVPGHHPAAPIWLTQHDLNPTDTPRTGTLDLACQSAISCYESGRRRRS